MNSLTQDMKSQRQTTGTIQSLEKDEYDVLLLDLNMPGMSGTEHAAPGKAPESDRDGNFFQGGCHNLLRKYGAR